MIFWGQMIGLYTIVRKEIARTLRLWGQTLLPPTITTILYFVIFGRIIGHRVGNMAGYPYIEFIAPGLIMMQVIMSAYNAAVASFFIAKFQRNIEELLVSPMSNIVMLIGYMLAGVFRGLLVGVIVSIVTLFFTHLRVYSISLICLSALLTAAIFSIAGLINGIFAKSFDDISIIPTFVLTPLTYLGGVFYSLTLLPEFWQRFSYANPIVYMVSTFRYGFFKITYSHLIMSYFLMMLLVVVLFFWALYLFKNASGLRY